MPTLDVAIIINPLSGVRAHNGNIGRQRVEIARSTLSGLAARSDVRVSEWPGHAIELATAFKASGVPLVVAWGGDGTINEVGNVLAFGETALGIVPAGAGNGLARELGVPADPTEAIESALNGVTRRIDAGELHNRLFFNVAGVGLDALVAHHFNSIPTGQRSLLGYIRAGAAVRWRFQPLQYAIEAEGESLRLQAQTIALANSRQYGNDAVIAPGARLDDGVLDLVVVEPRSLLGDLWRARGLFDGHGLSGVAITKQLREVEIASDSPMWLHVDGEAFQTSEVAVGRVHPAALKIRVRASADKV